MPYQNHFEDCETVYSSVKVQPTAPCVHILQNSGISFPLLLREVANKHGLRK